MRAQTRSRRKPTGGRYHKPYRSKRKFELARFAANTTLGKRKIKAQRVMGGNIKHKLISADFVNLLQGKKVVRVEILNVIDNPANKFLARRNILTKGCIVETKKGKARITSRPGQDGLVNAVPIQ